MLRKLLSSRKSFVVLLITTASFVALFPGKATWSDVADLLKLVVGSWLGAAGVEDAARHLGAGLRGRSADPEPEKLSAISPPPSAQEKSESKSENKSIPPAAT
jgi:hypothetical protein